MSTQGIQVASWINRAYVFVLEMLEQLQFTVCSLRQHGRAEGLHNLLDSDILVGELIPCRAVGEIRVSRWRERKA